MVRVIDIECDLPTPEAHVPAFDPPALGSGDTFRSREAATHRGHGMANYLKIFGPGRAREAGLTPEEFADKLESMEPVDLDEELRRRSASRREMSLADFVPMLRTAGVERAVIGTAQQPNQVTVDAVRAYPGLFVGFARISPWDGMAGVRELERPRARRRSPAASDLAVPRRIPASDRRYYPLYAKAPSWASRSRIHSSMNYATDRPYDLGHPRHLDQVAMDFPELHIIGGARRLAVGDEMVALVRRHPSLYLDTSAHRRRISASRARAGRC